MRIWGKVCSHVEVLGYGARQPRRRENGGILARVQGPTLYLGSFDWTAWLCVLTAASRSIEALAADETKRLLCCAVIHRSHTVLARLK